MNIGFCTICCANYLPKACLLAESIRRFHPEAILTLCIVERPQFVGSKAIGYDYVAFASDIGISQFDQFVFRHTVIEASTAVKAAFLQHLFDRFRELDLLIFLDPDIKLYSRLEEVFLLANRHDIIVTPHLLRDEETLAGTHENVMRVLRHGIYNLGFISVRRSAQKFLEWWRQRLSQLCFAEVERGVFVDQRWIDLAHGFFDMAVLRHPGYNVANWNVHQRVFGRSANGALTAEGEPVRFVHFSGVDDRRDLRYYKTNLRSSDHAVFLVREEYLQEVKEFDHTCPSDWEWTYTRFHSGEEIDRRSRVAYRNIPRFWFTGSTDPFSLSNADFVGWDPTAIQGANYD